MTTDEMVQEAMSHIPAEVYSTVNGVLIAFTVFLVLFIGSVMFFSFFWFLRKRYFAYKIAKQKYLKEIQVEDKD